MQLLNDGHATQTEKRAINQMIAQGMTNAGNKQDTKRYEVVGGYHERGYKFYTIKIWTKAKWFIGDTSKWRSSTVNIKAAL